LLEKYVGWRTAVVVPMDSKDKNLTFLALPPDLQKPTRRPNTSIASDKDRIATSRHPELDVKELQKILATPPPGAPGMNGPRAQQSPQAMAQNQPPAPQQGQQQTPRPQFQSDQTAQLQMPARPNNAFAKYGGGMTAGQAIQQATQGAAANRAAGGGQEGDFGLGTGAHGRQLGNLEVLSDTQGVDFGPYLQRILQEVRENWYRAIPESAEMKKGKLQIEFAITKDGKVADMRLTAGSGDVALDRAAWAGISASNPFPPLPSDFTGPYLALRFRFYYNPDIEVSISPSGDEIEVPVGGSKVFTATVIGTQETAVEWSVTGSGCTNSLCGKMAKDMYHAPSVLPTPPFVTLTAISKADATAKASVTVHIVQPRPLH